MTDSNVDNKVALITGANRGIGLETARQLAEHVSTVILCYRNADQLEKIKSEWPKEGATLDTLKLDIGNAENIQQAADYVAKEYGKLDILINNAAIAIENEWFVNTSTTVSISTLKETFDINFFSTIATTQAFLPLLKKSTAGRIVNLSSILGSLHEQSNQEGDVYAIKSLAYNSSKSALNSFTIHLAAALSDTNIKVNSAHPGWVKTEMGTDEAPMEVVDGAKTSVALALLPEDGPTGQFIHMGESVPW